MAGHAQPDRVAAVSQRTIIIGNSGSGKSTLAARVAASMRCAHVDLDTIYWADQRLLAKRVAPDALRMTTMVAAGDAWVIEGVFGWLVEAALPRATALIWLDLPWADCKAGLEARGPSASPSQAEYEALVAWAAQYWTRQTSSSHAGHQALFDRFAGAKLALHTRDQVAAGQFLSALLREGLA
jgi:hypothetical protein